jgi:hypothetical protein
MNRSPHILLAVLLPLMISCEKFFIEADQANTNVNNFELLWTEIDEKYSFFQYKNIDWDSVYQVYRPQISNEMTSREFFDIMAAMLNELRDGHVTLYSGFDRSQNYEWYASYPANFTLATVQANYLGEGFFNTGPFLSQIIDSVGYVYSGSFAREIRRGDVDTIIDRFSDLKGIIFDVRDNTGGMSKTARMIASAFADSIRLVSYTLYKTGPGHGDFSEPQPNYISPQGNRQFLKPVVVLSNRRTYSATNDFVLYMSAFHHVIIMGDQTGGGGGTPYDYELLNGWRCRFPRTQTLAVNGLNIEHGIAPTIRVNIGPADERNGIDTIIETALTYIKQTSFE